MLNILKASARHHAILTKKSGWHISWVTIAQLDKMQSPVCPAESPLWPSSKFQQIFS